MRKFVAGAALAAAAFTAIPAMAADIPVYPPIIEIPKLPDVDKGFGGFYLRGSAAGNLLVSRQARAWECPPAACGTPTPLVERSFGYTQWGYGYSAGVGAGFETGTGLRFDATLDLVHNEGLTVRKGPEFGARQGDYRVKLRSTLALANVYYDFPLSGGHGYGYHSGGVFGYAGAGAGVAFNSIDVTTPNAAFPVQSGSNTSLALAGMVGVGYDFGAIVADIGYRGVYINSISNGQPAPETVTGDDNLLHEVRATVRYRF